MVVYTKNKIEYIGSNIAEGGVNLEDGVFLDKDNGQEGHEDAT